MNAELDIEFKLLCICDSAWVAENAIKCYYDYSRYARI